MGVTFVCWFWNWHVTRVTHDSLTPRTSRQVVPATTESCGLILWKRIYEIKNLNWTHKLWKARRDGGNRHIQIFRYFRFFSVFLGFLNTDFSFGFGFSKYHGFGYRPTSRTNHRGSSPITHLFGFDELSKPYIEEAPLPHNCISCVVTPMKCHDNMIGKEKSCKMKVQLWTAFEH